MNRYLCKCGRAVNKSTNADNTGNRETEGCEGCPYLMPWGPTEWDHTRHAMVTDVKGYECRMSPTLEYRTELRGHLDDKTTIRITSLDFDFLECVSDWVKEHYPNCALPGFVDSKNEEKTERNAGYLVVSHSGGGMLRQGTRKGIRRTPANRGMRAHWVVKGLDISEDVCHGMCP